MSPTTRRRANGFTLIELLVPLLALMLVLGTFDLVVLLDWESHLTSRGVEPSAESLVRLLDEPRSGECADAVEALASEQTRHGARETLREAGYMALADLERAARGDNEVIRTQAEQLLPSARESWRERKLLLQVACRVLGRSGVEEARPALRQLAESNDYFLAKHARKALEELEEGPAPEPTGLSDEVRAILPEDSFLLVDSQSLRADPTRELQRILDEAAGPNPLNEAILELNRAVGNVEVREFRVVWLAGQHNVDYVVHLVIWGRFHQAAVRDWLLSQGAHEEVSSDGLWAGRITGEGGLPLLQIAMADGTTVACFADMWPADRAEPYVSTETLVELLKRYAR
jgi:hypothetical protein